MNALRITLCSLLLLISTAPLMAQGTYTQIDVPNGINGTFVQGTDSIGDLVGSYIDVDFNTHGFLFSGGVYTTIDYPGATYTLLTAINDVGQIVGVTNLNPPGAFLYDVATHTFTPIAYPRATSTSPYGINNSGTIVGYYSYGNGGATSGFELIGSQYYSVKPSNVANSSVYGISNSGEVVGGVPSRNQAMLNFLFKHGHYYPIAIPSAPADTAYGINPEGTALVGAYAPSSGLVAGFLYQNKVLQTLQFPGANATFAYGVNSSGEVVGTFYPTIGGVHGFTWTPSADAPKP